MSLAFNVTEFFPGFGTLCSPLTEGLRRFGTVKVAGAVELDGRYLRCFSRQHPEASTFLGSVTGYAPAEVSTGDRNTINVFLAGIPCTGASLAGRAKNHLSAAEMHEDVGHLFLPTMHYVTAHMPEICQFENVPQFATTFSAAAIRRHLTTLGYSIWEKVINPFKEFETATERQRWILVASRIGAFEWNYTPKAFTGTIESLLDPVTEQDKADQFTLEQVAAHTKYCDRKASEGCGFSRRILTRDSAKVPTIPKSYGKIQPTGVFCDSGTTCDSYRLLRPREVARIHGFGQEFIEAIESLPRTTAYEVLGQGVCAKPFRALGEAIGEFASRVSATAQAAA